MNQIFNLQSYKFINMCGSFGVFFLKFYSSMRLFDRLHVDDDMGVVAVALFK